MTAFSNSPELQLLQCCGRITQNDAGTARLQALLTQKIDWDTALRLAEIHRLLPLLDHHLQGAGQKNIPASVQASLVRRRHGARLRDQKLAEALHSLLDLFIAHGIDAIAYKGPVFAAQVYGDPALRPCSDLDILVPPHQVLCAKELLLAQGYQSQHHFADDAEEAAHLQTDCEYNFIRPDDGLLVEIHWRFRPDSFPFPLEIGELWGRRQTVLLHGRPVSTLSLEDYLLLLCVHGAKHRWERLLWVCDIAEIVRGCQNLPWKQIAAQARRLGCGHILHLGLMLARDLLDAPVPDSALRGTPLAVKALGGQIRRQLSGQPDILPSLLSRPLFHLAVRERWQDRLPYWKDRVRREREQAQHKHFAKNMTKEGG